MSEQSAAIAENAKMTAASLANFSWERMVAAVEDVRRRACRAAEALREAGIPHVVVGGNAVAAWVARVDREAVRNTKAVDLMVRRQDLARVIAELKTIGFIHQNVAGVDLFLDGPQGSVRSAIHVLFAGEKVWPDYLWPLRGSTNARPVQIFPCPRSRPWCG